MILCAYGIHILFEHKKHQHLLGHDDYFDCRLLDHGGHTDYFDNRLLGHDAHADYFDSHLLGVATPLTHL